MFTPLKGILWSFEPSKSGIMLPFQGKVSVRVKISYVNCGQENAFNSCVRTQGHTQCVFSGSAGCRQKLHRVPLSQYKHVKSKLCCTNTSANALNGCYAPSRRGGRDTTWIRIIFPKSHQPQRATAETEQFKWLFTSCFRKTENGLRGGGGGKGQHNTNKLIN